MAEPVYPIYPLQEETAAVQKFLADKKAYEAIAANLPAIEEKIARQQQIAKTGYSIQPPTLLESVSGFFIPRRVYSPEAQEQAILSIRDLEAQKAAIQNAQPPDLSSVRQAAFAPELPPGVAEIVASKTQAQEQPTPTPAPAAPEAAPAQEQKQPDQFSEFTNFIKKRDETRARAIAYVKKNFPREDLIDGLEMVQKMTDQYFPAPRNIAQPIIDQFTGKPLEGYALIGGKVEKIEKPKVETKALTESQSKALQFATAMKEADDQVTNLLKSSNYDPTNPLSTLPMFETLKSQDRKLYEGTVRDFAVAILRRTSGAHVSPTEFKITEETYFPQSGDSEAVLKAKERRRKRDVASVYADVPEDLRSKILSQQPSQPSQGGGGVVEFMRAPGSGGIIKK